jgi:hypothetical protein
VGLTQFTPKFEWDSFIPGTLKIGTHFWIYLTKPYVLLSLIYEAIAN